MSARTIGAVVLILAVGLGLGYSCGRSSAPEPPAAVPTDTADAAAYRERAESLEKALADTAGVLARARRAIAGLEARKPAVRVVYDTTLEFRDVPVVVAVSSRSGVVDVDVAGPVLPDSLGGGRQPETLEGYDLRRCDDGFVITAAGVVCNEARLGHLAFFARPALASSLGSWATIADDLRLSGELGARYRRCWSWAVCRWAGEVAWRPLEDVVEARVEVLWSPF